MPLPSLTANIGLCVFLFLVGLEIDTSIVKRHTSFDHRFLGWNSPSIRIRCALSVPLYHHFVDPSVHFTSCCLPEWRILSQPSPISVASSRNSSYSTPQLGSLFYPLVSETMLSAEPYSHSALLWPDHDLHGSSYSTAVGFCILHRGVHAIFGWPV